ncbi:MAG: ferrous iron transport protein A [Oscillospiraceae bacterium]
MNHTPYTLNMLKPGQKAIVIKITLQGALKRRLIDMGITPGTSLTLRKMAPLGDPIEIKIRGYALTLRKDDAIHIEVEEILI